MEAIENYAVEFAAFGPFRRGEVIPRDAVAALGADPADLVARGILSVTTRAVDSADAREAAAAAARLAAENAHLKAENAHLAAACEDHQEARDYLEKNNADLKAQNATLAGANQGLERKVAELSAEHDATLKKVHELTAELEAATAPPAKKT